MIKIVNMKVINMHCAQTLQLDSFGSICKRMVKMAKTIRMIRMVKMAKKIIEMIRMVKMIRKMVRRSQGANSIWM